MNRYVVTDQAKADLRDTWRYIARDNLEAADRCAGDIAARFQLLARFSNLGRTRDDIGPGLRSFAVEAYIIYYRRISGGIEVVRVLHGARDAKSFFE